MRRLMLLLLMLVVVRTAAAAVPPEWELEDLPKGTTLWWGVQVGSFKSRILATGTRTTFENYGWGPVAVREQGGEFAVIVGETDHPGVALFLREELRAADLEPGSVVSFPGTADRPPVGISGRFLPPFVPTPGIGPDAPLEAGAIQKHLRTVTIELEDERAVMASAMLSLWTKNETADPEFAAGALNAAELLRDQGDEPEMVLWIAGRLARREWPANADQQMRASELVAEVLHGNRQDWRGAWSAWRDLRHHPARTTSQQAADMLRQAALLVEALDRGDVPGRDFALVRTRLRRAAELAPEGDPSELPIQVVYLQTFAWEGNWARAEQLARALLARHPKAGRPHTDLARLVLAQSMERHEQWEQAIELLDAVVADPLPRAAWLRQGIRPMDITPRLLTERDRLRAQRDGLQSPPQ